MKRLALLVAAAATFLVVGAWQQGMPERAEATSGDYEVWVTVQGTNQIHVLAPTGTRGDDLNTVATIDYAELTGPGGAWEGTELRNPHMILFGLHGQPGSRYGYVGNVSSANTSVIDASAREVVAVLETGVRTHAIQASPDGSRALALAIGTDGINGCELTPAAGCGQVSEILTDLDSGHFTLGRTFDFGDFAETAGLPRFDPICGSFTPDSRFFYVTLWSGGLVVFEVNGDPTAPLFNVVRVFPAGTGPGEVAEHGCGVGYSTDGKRMFANSGSAHHSFYYVFDLETHQLVKTVDVSGLVTDLHGMMLSPIGHELVMVGRLSDNFIVINQRTGDLKPNKTFDMELEEPTTLGPAPDLVDFSPDGKWLYVTLRGPNPATGTHAIQGDPPGIAVIHYATGKVKHLIELDGDAHGIAVRRLHD